MRPPVSAVPVFKETRKRLSGAIWQSDQPGAIGELHLRESMSLSSKSGANRGTTANSSGKHLNTKEKVIPENVRRIVLEAANGGYVAPEVQHTAPLR